MYCSSEVSSVRETIKKRRSISLPICESSPEFSDNKGSASEEPNVCNIGVEAYTISI